MKLRIKFVSVTSYTDITTNTTINNNVLWPLMS